MKLVIVESPSKAKTIEKYLGKEYKVLASYGHVRQLPSKNGSIDPNNNFSIIWEEPPKAQKHLKDIAKEAKKANEIYLATDPDREGEAISWHINNYLNENKIINRNICVKRVVFNAITKENILEAFKNSRIINNKLVSAYLARTSLDYLVGFNISPILWHKLPGSRSAGRVQSVALKLICEREEQREDFKIEEYWHIEALLNKNNHSDNNFKAKLIVFNNKKLEKFSIKTQEEAEKIKEDVKNTHGYFVEEITKKQVIKNPHAPFTTSSLQQDAFNKLGFSAKKTMTLAQKLYEGINVGTKIVGLITYMRTDATDIVPSFLTEIRNYIQNNIGIDYLPNVPNKYKTKTKNAQEAHEAIRPTHIDLPPLNIKKYLSEDEYKLYSLIWNRTIASQMKGAKYSNTSVTIPNYNSSIILKASGSILEFDGFYKIYGNIKENSVNTLPELKEKDPLICNDSSALQHFTEPPPRYTEATLVKTLEELGIGRPSTYANIISVLINREYAYIENKKFYPEERGRILNSFLNKFFTKYVDYKFTANMEEDLDKISRGDSSFTTVLEEFWNHFSCNINEAKKISPTSILEALNEALGDKFIGPHKTCPKCGKGTLLIKYSKFGAFIACSLYPECKHLENLKLQKESTENPNPESHVSSKNHVFYEKPNSCEKISLKEGPYGFYIEAINEEGKTKRIPVPKTIDPTSLTLEEAQFLGSLPKKYNDITMNIGKFGPYLKKGNEFFSLRKENIFNLTLERAEEIIKEEKIKKEGTKLGIYPGSQESITLHTNRFGSYLMYNNQKVKIPKQYKNSNISLDQAIEIINSTNT